MFSSSSSYPQRLESPPPPSQFRRPWSPLELDTHDRTTTQGLRRQNSLGDTSLEVLDLADYSRALPAQIPGERNINAAWNGAYYPEYPATPPRSFSLASRTSLSTSPPSLTSCPTSASHTQAPRLYTQPPSHHPFSHPPQTPWSPPISSSGRSHNYPWLVDSQDITEEQARVDVSKFPEWSRNWYTSNEPPKARIDPYAPILNFDPATVSYDAAMGFNPARPFASTNESQRDLLPWSLDDDNTSKRITPEMKEERLRMLEREFGRKGMKQDEWYRGSKVIGSVDAKGNIITPGPKKRVVVRWMQGTFAFGAVVASLYSALILKPDGDPPPRGTVPAYLLYALSVITTIFMVYMFIIRLLCCSGKRSRKATQEGPRGMMVLPVQQLPGAPGKKKKGGKKGKNNPDGGVSVNLIVDPTMFGGTDRREAEKSDDEVYETSREPGRRRRGLFEGLAMEEQWTEARKRLKHMLFFDIALVLLWGMLFVVILLGKRCPAGKFEGWCDGYNVATALASFLCVSFCFSVFFNVKDLHLSKVSPRTRT